MSTLSDTFRPHRTPPNSNAGSSGFADRVPVAGRSNRHSMNRRIDVKS